MQIRYFKNTQIDKTRWNEIIDKAPNGLIYAYSWYLDELAEHWDALIMGDYEMIMPLPWTCKYGVYCIYMPFFVQRLGIYSTKPINSETYQRFLNAIPAKFRLIDLCLEMPESIENHKNIKIKTRTNYVLEMNRPYDSVYEGYRLDAKKKLRTNTAFFYKEGVEIKKVIDDYRKYIGPTIPVVKEQHYSRLEKSLLEAEKRNHLISAQVTDDEGIVLATGIFLVDSRRAYYIMGSQTIEGREKHATHFLLDDFFKMHCQQIKIFDFEGSDIPGVAEFFKKWGSQPEYYSQIRWARFPINLLKR